MPIAENISANGLPNPPIDFPHKIEKFQHHEHVRYADPFADGRPRHDVFRRQFLAN
jgi:hypothetical protein